MDYSSTAATDQSGLLSARFLDDPGGLVALEVSAPVQVSLALLDLLHQFGVSLTGYEADHRDGWARQRLSLTERDGTLVRAARRLRLQSEVMTLLDEPERS